MHHSGEWIPDGLRWSMLTKPTNLSAAGSSSFLINTRWLHCTVSAVVLRDCRTSFELENTWMWVRHLLMRCDQTKLLFFLQAFSTIGSQHCCCRFTSAWTALYFHCKFAYEDNRSCYKEKENGFLVNYRLLSNTLCCLQKKSSNFSIFLDH